MERKYSRVLDFFYQHIPQTHQLKFSGGLGLARMRYLMSCFGNPQNSLRVIHVAGTSGKGSTCYLIATLLKSQGFKVGLHLSPHLLDIRERFQIDNQLLSKTQVINYFNSFKKHLANYQASKYGEPTYFELLVAFAFYIFGQEKVDYAVVETGLGGTYDGTNVVDNQNKLAVITTIGKDHTRVLGKTLSAIATQKAGIIGKGNLVLTTEKRPELIKLFNSIAMANRTRVLYVNEKDNFPPFGHLGLLGKHQITNASLALAVVEILSERDDFLINHKKLEQALTNAHFPGRLDIRNFRGATLILDGAHNTQKMGALVESLEDLFPKQKFNFVVAFKGDKDYRGMLRLIIPLSKQIYLTRFTITGQDLKHISLDPVLAAKFLQQSGFNHYTIIDSTKEYLQQPHLNKTVFTGSLYFLAEVYSALNRF